MKFSLNDPTYSSLDPSMRKEISDKLFAAEKKIALLRFLIIFGNSLIYIFWIPKAYAIEELAYPIIVIANTYSCFVVFFHPYKKYSLLLTSFFTSGTDAALIALWLTATGGFESPFYPLWYISILAIAMRYTSKVTYITAFVYVLLYTMIFLAEQHYFGRPANFSDLAIRLSYLVITAVLGALMAQQIIDQIQAKQIIRKSEEEIRRQKQELKQAHERLEKRVEERTAELAETNKQLLKINEEIDSFVYSASHDLKSPILNIEALLAILYEGSPDASGYEQAIREKLTFSVEKMKNTINHLAEVAKAQKEVYDDECIVRFDEILYDLIGENEEIIKRENVQLQYNFSLASSINCSRKCIKSIMYNFLTNSIKYRSPERSPVIVFRTERSKEHITLLVQDNGLGIDLQRNGTKLFSLFKRFHDHVEGAGIGLYTVKKMVEKYQGDIGVESQPGQGTTFKVRFKVPGH